MTDEKWRELSGEGAHSVPAAPGSQLMGTSVLPLADAPERREGHPGAGGLR
jgi:hypothetical protein